MWVKKAAKLFISLGNRVSRPAMCCEEVLYSEYGRYEVRVEMSKKQKLILVEL